jgi:uncharacterized protein with von Willebrand factor type A (vWA) domain
LLRASGIDITPGRIIAAVKALDCIMIGRKQDFYLTLRCILVHNHDDQFAFDQAFNIFWASRINIQESLPLQQRLPKSSFTPKIKPSRSAQKGGRDPLQRSGKDEDQQVAIEAAKTYSDIEILREKDFAEMDQDEIDAVHRLMAELVWRLGTRRSRRYRPGKGQILDFRRSLRNSMRYGGELLVWSQRQHRYKPRPLVIIADISGSMDRYVRLLLHFIYTLTSGLNHSVETFVFSTRLTHITRQLRDKDVNQAMNEVSQSVPDWSGGTRIGMALKNFNYDWARRVLGRGAVVLIISDGWDRGDPLLMSREMARLQRSCFRLIWLNPLLGLPNYEPITKGMETALPFIDDFLAVNNLHSLEKLAAHLLRLDDRRPIRRQQTVSPNPLTRSGQTGIFPS